MRNASFSILITTKNRKNDLEYTLQKIKYLIDRDDVECIICDDGSTDETAFFLQTQYPKIQFIQNQKSLGLIYCRNRMMNMVKSEFVISIDDDLHFITQNPLELISDYFKKHPLSAVLSFRIFWSKKEPVNTTTSEKSTVMQSYAGGAHAFRMKAWHNIPNYPAWFIFYGEEDFAAYQLFKKGWEIHYLPEVLVNHRVDVKSRIKNVDYQVRLRRSSRAGWYLFFLFYPMQKIPRKMAYSIWMQFRLKVFKGDMKALQAISLALWDLVFAIPKIIQNSNRLTLEEYNAYQKLPETKIYWEPEK
jgi:glycosyltransferase involved in cell wall biosynthesis